MRQRRRGLALFGAVITAGWIGIVSVGSALGQELGNTVFFRGGYTRMNDNRANQVFTDTFRLQGANDSQDGWFVGAGLELFLSRNLWGIMPKTWALGEVAIEYRNFGIKDVNRVVPTAVNALLPTTPSGVQAAAEAKSVRLTAFTVDIGPKIKFLEGSRIRPWIIPFALGIHVISPPSNAATVLDIGYQFGGGVEYELLHGIVVGVDARYNIVAGHAFSGEENRSNNFLTTGGYIGISF